MLEFPAGLLAALPVAAWLFLVSRRAPGLAPERRTRLRLLCRGLALTLLVLALAGLRWPGESRALRVVAAVDLSASVYDRSAQATALHELAEQLASAEADLGVVVFGKEGCVERPPAPLPAEAGSAERGQHVALPNLLRPLSVFSPEATDIGAALDRARSLLNAEGVAGRAVVLISDGLDTAGRDQAAAAALNGSGVDLLAWPATLSGGGDVYVAALRLPQEARAGLGLPVEVTIGGQRAATVKVRLGRRVARGVQPVGSQVVKLEGAGEGPGRAFRATVRFVDRPAAPGVVVYVATVEGPDGREIPGNYRANDTLSGAVRVAGPARWAVLARPGSTLARWTALQPSPLGAELVLLTAASAPASAEQYQGFTGVLVDGLSEKDLPADSPALKALSAAVRSGTALLAVGGEAAFGAGGHPENGEWESILPVTLLPEDDRLRTVLVVLDVSKTMDQTVRGQQKLAFAQERLQVLARDARAIPPANRLGLAAFSEQARLAAPLTTDRAAFITALNGLRIGNQTHFLEALDLARTTLAQDEAEEQLVIFVSDGEPVPTIPDEDLLTAVRALCPEAADRGPKPRRTRLHCFGVGTSGDRNEPGEKRMQGMAQAGGGSFFPEFPRLAESLRAVLQDTGTDRYVRHEPFRVVAPLPSHPVLTAAGPSWPILSFRNRVKARPESVTLAQSAPPPGAEAARGARKPDPLVVLGHCGLAQTAVVALTLDGPDARGFLAPGESWRGGQALLAALMSWVESQDEGAKRGWRVETQAEDENLRVTLSADDPVQRAPVNGLELTALLRPLESGEGEQVPAPAPLLPVAPGRYVAEFPLPARDLARRADLGEVCRLQILERGEPRAEQFVSLPYPAEYRRFGTDRVALAELVRLAGGHSRMLDVPDTVKLWLKDAGARREYASARPVLLLLAALLLLAEVAARGMRRGT
jgi:Mg-chelatase subunit ChlD